MVHCVAFGCHNTSDKKKPDQKISFFSFPKDKSRRNIWICLMKREEYNWKSTHRLCSDHFTKDQYAVDPDWMAQYGYLNAKPELKSDALPSFKFPDKTAKSNPISRGAYAKRRKQEILQKAISSYSPGIEVNKTLDDSVDTGENVDNEMPSTSSTINNCSIETQFSPHCMPRSTQVKPDIRSKGSQVTPAKCDSGCQAKPQTVEIGIQTDESLLQGICTPENFETDLHEDMDDESFQYDDPDTDPDYQPDFHDIVERELEIQMDADKNPLQENKYLVYHSSLMQLFTICREPGCHCPVEPRLKTCGTCLSVHTECSDGHCTTWSSQPADERLAWGNLSVAAVLLFSGSSYKKMATFFNLLKVPFISSNTYYKIQRSYLIPVVCEYWKGWQDVYLEMLQGTEVTVAGDGRCDSPGHCAKYCSYSLMDVENNKILDTQIVQSNEVQSPCHMELEGLKRSLTTIESSGVIVSKVVTDRHSQVKKYMREEHPDKAHDFDVWHVAKGTEKKLLTAAQRSNGSEIKPWISSIKNHMYWVATTSGDDGPLKRAKWLSVLNHISNQHSGHSDIFPECSHGQLDDDRYWIDKGSIPYQLLEPVVNSNYLLKDIEKLSPVHQTYGLEVFHRVILSFAPKTLHYFYWGMTARTYLAAIHYNENSEKVQAHTKGGQARYAQVYPKRSRGERVVIKPVRENPTYNYVSDLLDTVVQRRRDFPTYTLAYADATCLMVNTPPPLTADYVHANKDYLVEKHASRFPQNKD